MNSLFYYSNNNEKEWQLYIKIIMQCGCERSFKKLIMLATSYSYFFPLKWCIKGAVIKYASKEVVVRLQFSGSCNLSHLQPHPLPTIRIYQKHMLRKKMQINCYTQHQVDLKKVDKKFI